MERQPDSIQVPPEDNGGPQYRTMDIAARDLKIHVEGKLRALSKFATHFKLTEDVVEAMRHDLQTELDVLSHVPPELTLKEIIDNYWGNSKKFKEKILPNIEQGNNCSGCSYCRFDES